MPSGHEAFSVCAGVAAPFDYNVPDTKGGAFVPPPQVSSPDSVVTWNQFTQQTTIHGVKYIFDPHSTSKCRK